MSRVIYRFGRSYSEFNPGGGGPPTWVLNGTGSGGGGGTVANPTAVFTPLLPAAACRVGMPLYLRAANVADLALAADPAPAGVPTCEVIGLAVSNANAGGTVEILCDGQLSLSDWTLIAGTALLKPGARYFLSPAVAGQITGDCPTTPGVTVVKLGVAISTTTLEVEIEQIVHL